MYHLNKYRTVSLVNYRIVNTVIGVVFSRNLRSIRFDDFVDTCSSLIVTRIVSLYIEDTQYLSDFNHFELIPILMEKAKNNRSLHR